MENRVCGVAHNVSQARESLAKALCALDAHANTDYSKLLEIVKDYIVEASAKWLCSAEDQLDELREKMKEEPNHE